MIPIKYCSMRFHVNSGGWIWFVFIRTVTPCMHIISAWKGYSQRRKFVTIFHMSWKCMGFDSACVQNIQLRVTRTGSRDTRNAHEGTWRYVLWCEDHVWGVSLQAARKVICPSLEFSRLQIRKILTRFLAQSHGAPAPVFFAAYLNIFGILGEGKCEYLASSVIRRRWSSLRSTATSERYEKNFCLEYWIVSQLCKIFWLTVSAARRRKIWDILFLPLLLCFTYGALPYFLDRLHNHNEKKWKLSIHFCQTLNEM